MPISRLDYENMRSRTERAKGKPYASLYGNKFAAKKVDDEISELHVPILKWCKDNNVAVIHCRTDKKSTATMGAPDFTIVYKGYVWLIECKAKDGELSPPQCAWIRQAADHRVTVHVITSMADFHDLMNMECV